VVFAEEDEAWIGGQGKRFFVESEISGVHRYRYEYILSAES
jgi:hypothetical protein